ncbi:hypothetical protein EVAR_9021_1 [Eumeta japonica]|uniref:Uncharacterized protein n=1 Tax=Eumeta variegata TaxID=151549 RepID=A0A4C1TVY4_EUMVA|nr:hypothetical protein EVAR_9021_1 [Eumeta japonica]
MCNGCGCGCCGGLEPTEAGEALEAEGGAGAGGAGGEPPGGDACASSYSAPPTPFIMVHQAEPAEWPEAGAGDAAVASQAAPRPPTWLSGYSVAAGQATGPTRRHNGPVQVRRERIAHPPPTHHPHMKYKTRLPI